MPISRAVIVLIAIAGLAAWLALQDGASGEQSVIPAANNNSAGRRDDAPPDQPAPQARETVPPDLSHIATTSAAIPSTDARPLLDLRTIHACRDALLDKKSLEQQTGCDDIPADQVSILKFCRGQQARATREVNDAAAGAAPCPPDLVTASAYYNAIKELALRGDIPAQRCFIQGYFAGAAGEGEESRLQKEQVDEYPGLARKFIDEAFERGDWSVVRSLARMRLGLQDGMLRTAYPFGSEYPETAYRMNYLLVLGNQQNFEKRIDERQLVEGFKTNNALSRKQLEEAESWARNMYDQHFNGSREGASTTRLCERASVVDH